MSFRGSKKCLATLSPIHLQNHVVSTRNEVCFSLICMLWFPSCVFTWSLDEVTSPWVWESILLHLDSVHTENYCELQGLICGVFYPLQWLRSLWRPWETGQNLNLATTSIRQLYQKEKKSMESGSRILRMKAIWSVPHRSRLTFTLYLYLNLGEKTPT